MISLNRVIIYFLFAANSCLFAQPKTPQENLKKMTTTTLTFSPGDSKGMKTVSVCEYNKHGDELIFVRIANSDTIIFNQSTYNENNRLTRFLGKYSGDSTTLKTYTYNKSGMLVASDQITDVLRAYMDPNTGEIIPQAYTEHKIFNVLFDKKGNPVEEKFRMVTYTVSDTTNDFTSSVFMEYTYDKNDSILSLKRKEYNESAFSTFMQNQFDQSRRISSQYWYRSGNSFDSSSTRYVYDANGNKIKEIKEQYYMRNGKVKLSSTVEVDFAKNSATNGKRETSWTDNSNAKRIQYFSGEKIDSTFYFEDGKSVRIKDTIPQFIYDDGYNPSANYQHAVFTYDAKKRISTMSINGIEGETNDFAYEYSGKLLSKKTSSLNSLVNEIDEYKYDFY